MCAGCSAEMREMMKRSFEVAAVLLVLGVTLFVSAIYSVNGQSESIVIKEDTLYGNPDAAAGLKLRVTSQWQDYLVWNTVYNVGSGETESNFSFYPYTKNWREPVFTSVEMWMPLQWGMSRTSSPSSSFDPEGSFLPEVVRAVMEKTAVGESHSETVCLSDYYEYFPLRLSVECRDLNVHYYDDDVKFYADFFHIPVPDWLTLEIVMEKDETGDVIALECNSENSMDFFEASAFGQEGCYFAYYLEDVNGIGIVETGADYGIYYVPYLIGKYSNSIDTEQTRMLCSLMSGMVPVDMALNEELGELYLVTMEEEGYYLNVYQIEQEKLIQKQKIFVRSVSGEPGGEGNPYWAQMSVHDEGVLMVWKDGKFAFVVQGEKEMKLWCLEQHPGSEMIFPYEHVWAFDGQRLAVASLADWESMNVELAVFQDGELVWYGACNHSGNAGNDQVSFSLRILPPGTLDVAAPVSPEYYFYRRRNSVTVEELLELEWLISAG